LIRNVNLELESLVIGKSAVRQYICVSFGQNICCILLQYGKKIFLQPFANIPIFVAKVCALNFFQDEFTPWP